MPLAEVRQYYGQTNWKPGSHLSVAPKAVWSWDIRRPTPMVIYRAQATGSTLLDRWMIHSVHRIHRPGGSSQAPFHRPLAKSGKSLYQGVCCTYGKRTIGIYYRLAAEFAETQAAD
jgi:hypothetical protein